MTQDERHTQSGNGLEKDSEWQCRRNRTVARWYVLTVPPSRFRTTNVSAVKGLEAEAERRIRENETPLEFFAPTCTEVRKIRGKLVHTDRPLLFNYVFIHASENEIFRMKRDLPTYNFLPRVNDGQGYHFPYLSDQEMQRLRWMSEMFRDGLPVYQPENDFLAPGDRVRIINGAMKGFEAEVAVQPGSGTKNIVVRVLDCMWVPLLNVGPDDYEVISLRNDGRRIYSSFDNPRLSEGLHEALLRFHRDAVTPEDLSLANEIIRKYAQLKPETDVLRCKLFSLLLPAYLILQDTHYGSLLSSITSQLSDLKGGQSHLLLLATLFGCTGEHHFRDMFKERTADWDAATAGKSRQTILHRLESYDQVHLH